MNVSGLVIGPSFGSFFSLEFWYEFHVWDPSGKYGSLRFFVRRRPSFLVYLITMDIDLGWRLKLCGLVSGKGGL